MARLYTRKKKHGTKLMNNYWYTLGSIEESSFDYKKKSSLTHPGLGVATLGCIMVELR
jgi:hypothetical protein